MICENNFNSETAFPIEISLKRERETPYFNDDTKRIKWTSTEAPTKIFIEVTESLKRENEEVFVFTPNKKQKVAPIQQHTEKSTKRKRELTDVGEPRCSTPIDPALCYAYSKRVDQMLILLSGAFEAAQTGRSDDKVLNQICFVVNDTVTSLQDQCIGFDERVQRIAQMAFVLCEWNQGLANVIGEKVLWLNQPFT